MDSFRIKCAGELRVALISGLMHEVEGESEFDRHAERKAAQLRNWRLSVPGSAAALTARTQRYEQLTPAQAVVNTAALGSGHHLRGVPESASESTTAPVGRRIEPTGTDLSPDRPRYH